MIPEPKSTEEIFNSAQYQKFIDSMVSHCRCTGQPRPCDGVLAGGICDDMQEDQTEYFDRWEEDEWNATL